MTLSTNHQTRTVGDFANLYKLHQLNLAPAFQRQSVWTTTDRRLLIKSLLEGVPLPAIYLYQQAGSGGKTIYDVIDGKQRLETILLFMGRGPLADAEELWVRANFRDDEPLDWWSWGHLSGVQRNDFLSARLPTIEIKGELSEIASLFVRINSTGKRLTTQERRHAFWPDSPVLEAAQSLAEKQRSALVRHGVLSRGQILRMKDVELLAELLLSVNAGGPINKKEKIDQVIKGNSITRDEAAEAATRLQQALKATFVILPRMKETRLRQLADFYSLVLLMERYRSEGLAVSAHNSGRNRIAGVLLTEFSATVEEVNERMAKGKGVTKLQEPFQRYLATVKEGNDRRTQRVLRERLLRDVLDGVFEQLDSRRTFNPTQRRILWHGSTLKKCSLCGAKILRWEDLSIDHIQPYIKGGKTDLVNGAIAHRTCNLQKGARSSARR